MKLGVVEKGLVWVMLGDGYVCILARVGKGLKNGKGRGNGIGVGWLFNNVNGSRQIFIMRTRVNEYFGQICTSCIFPTSVSYNSYMYNLICRDDLGSWLSLRMLPLLDISGSPP